MPYFGISTVATVFDVPGAKGLAGFAAAVAAAAAAVRQPRQCCTRLRHIKYQPPDFVSNLCVCLLHCSIHDPRRQATSSDSLPSSSDTGALCPKCGVAASGSRSPSGTAASSPRGNAGGDAGGATPMLCYAVRLTPGEELKGALAAFVSDRGIRVSMCFVRYCTCSGIIFFCARFFCIIGMLFWPCRTANRKFYVCPVTARSLLTVSTIARVVVRAGSGWYLAVGPFTGMEQKRRVMCSIGQHGSLHLKGFCKQTSFPVYTKQVFLAFSHSYNGNDTVNSQNRCQPPTTTTTTIVECLHLSTYPFGAQEEEEDN